MSKMETYDLLESISTEKLYLTVTGFYPIKIKSQRYKYLYKLSTFVHLSVSWLQFISLVTFAYFNRNDLMKVTETFLFCMTQFALLNKLTNLMSRRKGLVEMEELLKSNIFTSVTVEDRYILKSHVDKGKLQARIFRWLCVGVVSFYAVYPFIDDRSQKVHRYPLPCWFPFDEVKYYYWAYFFEMWTLSLSAFMNSSIDIVTVKLMIIATAQFKILARKLINILGPLADVIMFNEDILIRSKLRECIELYDKVLYLVSHIEATFSKGIFIQFFCSVIVICLTGFQMLLISFNSIQFVLLIIYINCMMCQITMYCWFGHVVMESSDQITSACYMSQWDKCSLDVRKSLVIIMERAKKPATIRAGGFFTLNLPTLMTILRSSYSYFAVLQRMYGNSI